jgi:hypothetical protein
VKGGSGRWTILAARRLNPKPPDDWYWVAFRRKVLWGLRYERGGDAPLANAGFTATL